MAHTRGPSTFQELTQWLVDAGYSIVPGGKHQIIMAPDGHRAFVLSRTPSDYRSLRNTVSDIRRATGLSLRRPHG
jgi:hypothetical protein